jgi:hypothetical protein
MWIGCERVFLLTAAGSELVVKILGIVA